MALSEPLAAQQTRSKPSNCTRAFVSRLPRPVGRAAATDRPTRRTPSLNRVDVAQGPSARQRDWALNEQTQRLRRGTGRRGSSQPQALRRPRHALRLTVCIAAEAHGRSAQIGAVAHRRLGRHRGHAAGERRLDGSGRRGTRTLRDQSTRGGSQEHQARYQKHQAGARTSDQMESGASLQSLLH